MSYLANKIVVVVVSSLFFDLQRVHHIAVDYD